MGSLYGRMVVWPFSGLVILLAIQCLWDANAISDRLIGPLFTQFQQACWCFIWVLVGCFILFGLLVFFCSRDCCLCAVHQSVKERRHAKKQRQNGETRPNQPKTKTPTKNPTQPKTPPQQEAFAASETSETAFTRNRWNMSNEAS